MGWSGSRPGGPTVSAADRMEAEAGTWEAVQAEAPHFLVTGITNLVARNPYVFAVTLIAHGGYHLYENYFGSQDGVGVQDVMTAGGIVGVPGPEVLTSGPDVRPRSSSVQGARQDFRRCTVKTRRGKRCVLRSGHSSKHRF